MVVSAKQSLDLTFSVSIEQSCARLWEIFPYDQDKSNNCDRLALLNRVAVLNLIVKGN